MTSFDWIALFGLVTILVAGWVEFAWGQEVKEHTYWLLIVRGEAIGGVSGSAFDDEATCKAVEARAAADPNVEALSTCIPVVVRPKITGERT